MSPVRRCCSTSLMQIFSKCDRSCFPVILVLLEGNSRPTCSKGKGGSCYFLESFYFEC